MHNTIASASEPAAVIGRESLLAGMHNDIGREILRAVHHVLVGVDQVLRALLRFKIFRKFFPLTGQ